MTAVPHEGALSSAAPGPPLPPRPRILMPRACRTPQFADAVRRLRQLYPDAELIALAPERLTAEAREAGADQVEWYDASRFGLLHAGPRVLARLRERRFDAVAIPQMSDDFPGHANVYRLAAAIGTPVVLVLPFDRPLRSFSSYELIRFVTRESLQGLLRRWDVPLFLVVLAAAAVRGIWHRAWARRRPVPAGRRRVLHIITTLGVGGAQVQLAELVDRTPTDRYDVDILVLGRADGTFSVQRFARTDVNIDYVDSWPVLTAAVIDVAARCRRGRYDIVHTWLFYANVVGAAGARLAGTPFIVSGIRNLSLWKRIWTAKWWYRLGDILAARIPDLLTVNANPLVDDHRWWARTRRAIAVVPNGLSPSRVLAGTSGARGWLRRELGLNEGVTVVGTVGRLAPEKDQAIFLKAMAMARERSADVHAVVVGDGECGARLKALAAELGLGTAVTFLGRRSDSRRIIAGLDLFVLTSQSEGFPNVLLECAFLGTPAISSDVAGARDVLDAEASLFPVADAAAAAACVLSHLADPAGARTRANAVRTRAYRLFTAERMAARWLELYGDRRRALTPES
jgi:glycosyltransferase involved in cell wall biosynthesis